VYSNLLPDSKQNCYYFHQQAQMIGEWPRQSFTTSKLSVEWTKISPVQHLAM